MIEHINWLTVLLHLFLNCFLFMLTFRNLLQIISGKLFVGTKCVFPRNNNETLIINDFIWTPGWTVLKMAWSFNHCSIIIANDHGIASELIRWADLNWCAKHWVKRINKSRSEIKLCHRREIKKSAVLYVQENCQRVKFPLSPRKSRFSQSLNKTNLTP